VNAPNVDLVLVIDASDSMKPCIDQLRRHLRELVKPMQGHVGRVRFGVVSLSASDVGGSHVYRVRTLAGDEAPLYDGTANQFEFFTADADKVTRALDAIEVSADEHNLLALDIALDHPFGSTSDTKRVVALFSDEPLEAGIEGQAALEKLPALIDKIHKRRVKLFCALPYSEAAQQLSEANGSELEIVDAGQGGGLAGVDFRALLSQMGKSISVSSLQGALSEGPPQPLFGQDRWTVTNIGWNSQDGR
jgi:hypothetical protein